MKQVRYKGLTFEPYIENEKIKARVQELGAQISKDCQGKNPLFICVLKGAFPFASELFLSVDIDAQITFMRLKSYEGTGSTGRVKEIMGLSEDLTGRTVVVIEDIIDTGNTMKKLIEDLRERGAADIKIATLLFKPDSVRTDIKPDYIGFNIPSKFIIGFGLDIDGMARNLKDIWALCDRYYD